MPETPVGYANVTARIQLNSDLEPMSTSVGLHLLDPASFDQADANSIATAMGTFLKGTFTGIYQVTNVNVYAGTTAGDISFDSASGNGAGTATGSELPQNCSFLIRKSGALAGRKNRGRMYVPGCREAQVSPTGQVDSNEIVRITALLDTWFNTRTTSAVYDDFVILHAYGDATLPTPITAMRVDPVIATQRRRMRR